MNTKTELLKKHAEELQELEKTEAIRAILPEQYRDDALVCIHGKHASVKMWGDFRTEKKLSEALEIVRQFEPLVVECEHWESGCLSVRPAEINKYATDEHAIMDGASAVELSVTGGKGFGPNVTVEFWIKHPEFGFIEINLPVCDLHKLTPNVRATYNNSGELCSCEINWPGERSVVDKFRSWWSQKPAYHGSYYLADLPNFYAWASNHTKQ